VPGARPILSSCPLRTRATLPRIGQNASRVRQMEGTRSGRPATARRNRVQKRRHAWRTRAGSSASHRTTRTGPMQVAPLRTSGASGADAPSRCASPRPAPDRSRSRAPRHRRARTLPRPGRRAQALGVVRPPRPDGHRRESRCAREARHAGSARRGRGARAAEVRECSGSHARLWGSPPLAPEIPLSPARILVSLFPWEGVAARRDSCYAAPCAPGHAVG
jgi:hypothetical protein